jgi:pimeloyl-ACP methyl ester carboxylesterase
VGKLPWIIAAVVANTVAVATIVPEQESLDGRWTGAISVAGQVIPMTVRFAAAEAGGMSAAIDVQGATGLALQNVSYEPPKVHFELPAGAGLAVFDGQQAGDSIGGTFMQAGITGSFSLARSEAAATAPAEPLPYAAEEVTFHHGEVRLAGTLTLPERGAPYPAAVMITGSGPQNRDEELFGFKPFAVIADHLTRHGIAILRYDDRGVGGSTGTVSDATSADFAGDVVAAIELLRARDDIDGDHIGLIGHSEGGIVAPLVARQTDVAFMVLLAGTAVPGAAVILEQGAAIARAGGTAEDEIARWTDFEKRTFQVVRTGEGWDRLAAEIRTQLRATIDAMPTSQRAAIPDIDQYIDAQVQAQVTQARTPWFRFFLDYDPAATLRAIDTPVLALFGERDLQVLPSQNRGPMETAFREGHHPDYTIRILPGANHLFMPATTGSPAEYATLPKEFVPELLPLITEWISQRAQ